MVNMNKKGMILGGIVIVAILGIAASLQAFTFDAQRQYGTITTDMGSPLLGDPDASITIVEFGDYQCHQCHNWFHNTKPLIQQNYIDTGKINLVFIDLAFLGPDSPKAAQASYCAQDQDMYWQYHDALYTFQEPKYGWPTTERLHAFAFSLGLDMELFDDCFTSGKYSKRVSFNINEAKKAGANATPTFVIIGPNGDERKLVGAQPYPVFKKVFDSMV